MHLIRVSRTISASFARCHCFFGLYRFQKAWMEKSWLPSSSLMTRVHWFGWYLGGMSSQGFIMAGQIVGPVEEIIHRCHGDLGRQQGSKAGQGWLAQAGSMDQPTQNIPTGAQEFRWSETMSDISVLEIQGSCLLYHSLSNYWHYLWENWKCLHSRTPTAYLWLI